MARLAPMMQLRPRFEDKCGHPLAGGSVFAFEVGTSTPKETFKDADGTIPNTHPIKLDYRGEADIYLLSGRYRFVVYSCYGVKIYDVDDVGEWLGVITADRVIDGDKTQKQINEEQNERKSVKLWSSGLADALGKFDAVDFDKDETVSAPVLLVSGQIVNSNGHELNQVTPTTIVLEGQYGASDIVIDGLSIQQDKSGVVSGGTNNNHAAIKIRGGLRNKIKNLVLDSQLGISLGMGEAGAADRRSMFNVIRDIVFKNTNIGVEHIGASYNQSMNIVVDPQDKGSFMGDRGTGYDKIENPDE
ncbi:TPA: hypothetical protein ACHQJM_003887, partial [Acinetobacter baumannii]